MHPPRTRETIQATRTEANHGVRGVTEIDQLAGNAVYAHNDAASLILNDADQ
jgi:hypothetical protein